MNSGIYGIQNTVNNKWYIGQSLNLLKRKDDHLYFLRRGLHKNCHLQRAFTQYGENNFRIYFIERIPEEKIDEAECYWIAMLYATNRNFGYNIETGGCTQKRRSPETIAKVSAKLKGRVFSPETIKRMSEGQRGRIPSEYQRKRCSETFKGKHHTPEHCRKISESNKGRYISKETRAKIAETLRQKPLTLQQKQHLFKMARNNIGRTHTQETKQKISNARKGIKLSPETCRRISEAKKLYYKKMQINQPEFSLC